jgi:hypothetical protein
VVPDLGPVDVLEDKVRVRRSLLIVFTSWHGLHPT